MAAAPGNQPGAVRVREGNEDLDPMRCFFFLSDQGATRCTFR